jgi:hypothetical protein
MSQGGNKMSEQTTPETDAAWACFKGHTELLHDVQNLSRKLERERDEAREQNAKLRDIAEMAITAVALWAGSRTNSAPKLRAELERLKEDAK